MHKYASRNHAITVLIRSVSCALSTESYVTHLASTYGARDRGCTGSTSVPDWTWYSTRYMLRFTCSGRTKYMDGQVSLALSRLPGDLRNVGGPHRLSPSQCDVSRALSASFLACYDHADVSLLTCDRQHSTDYVPHALLPRRHESRKSAIV